MKAFKFVLSVIFSMSLLTFSSCSNDDDNINPSTPFQEALSVKYPDATAVEWEKKSTYTVAECWVNNKDLDVWFNDNASWVMTETELISTDLPEAVSNALAQTEYAGWKIDDIDLLEYPSTPKVYVIEVEQGAQEWDLYFSEEGELLNKKDVSATDDEHWPDEESTNGVATRSLYSLYQTLKAMYPNARDIEWERKRNYQVAECEVNRKDLEVWFTNDGTWVMTEHELRKSDLPSVISQNIKSSYPKWKIDSVELLEYPDKENLYVVEIEYRSQEWDLYYSQYGELRDRN